MAKAVTRYEAKDGSVHLTEHLADANDCKAEIINYFDDNPLMCSMTSPAGGQDIVEFIDEHQHMFIKYFKEYYGLV